MYNNYYLLDYENTKLDNLLDQLCPDDCIILFYSTHCKIISLDILSNIQKKNVNFHCLKVITGTKNALDFQLASYLGYLIGNNQENTKYYIISGDKGYDCLCEYWREQGKVVERIEFSIPNQERTVICKTKKITDSASLEEIEKVLSCSDESKVILQIFNKHNTKKDICNGIAKYFKDSKKAGSIYKKLKPLLKEKHKK